MTPSTVCLTEAELRQVLLAQALEAQAGQSGGPPWTADESVQASAAARRQLGEKAGGGEGGGQGAGEAAFLVARAREVLARLGHAAPALRDAQGHGGVASLLAVPASAWWIWPVLAFGLGLAGDALGSGTRIQLLALPLLGVLAWNLLVYVGLAVGAVLRSGGRRGAASRATPTATPASIPAANAGIQQMLSWAAGWIHRVWLRGRLAGQPAWLAPALRRQAEAAAPMLAPAQRQRGLAALHASAAALALGAIGSMYLRGLALDYRAGWDSTFLQAPQVHALLAMVMAPALQWHGLALPGVPELATLRFADGSLGAPAAPWIHRLAISLLVWVVLPRLLLAAGAAWRARRAAQACHLPADHPGLAEILRQAPAHQAPAARSQPVTVLPYSYQLPAASQAGLAKALAQHLGSGAWPALAPSLPLGAEDHLPASLPARLHGSVLVLMALTATPERETHGALLRALPAHLPPGCTAHLWLDSAGFVQRLAGQPDAAQRLQQRSQAWARLAADAGWPAPLVLDLSAPCEGQP